MSSGQGCSPHENCQILNKNLRTKKLIYALFSRPRPRISTFVLCPADFHPRPAPGSFADAALVVFDVQKKDQLVRMGIAWKLMFFSKVFCNDLWLRYDDDEKYCEGNLW